MFPWFPNESHAFYFGRCMEKYPLLPPSSLYCDAAAASAAAAFKFPALRISGCNGTKTMKQNIFCTQTHFHQINMSIYEYIPSLTTILFRCFSYSSSFVFSFFWLFLLVFVCAIYFCWFEFFFFLCFCFRVTLRFRRWIWPTGPVVRTINDPPQKL